MNEENKSQQADSEIKTEPAKDEKPKKEKQKKGNRSFFEKYLKN